MQLRHATLSILLGISLSFGACGKNEAQGSGSGGGKGAPAVEQKNTKASLAALLKKIQAARKADKSEVAGALTRGLLPDKTRLTKALKPGVSEAQVAQMVQMHERFAKAPDARLGGLLRAKDSQTEIQVHCAKTEEIAANAPGSIVFKEFPGGAVSLAKNVLRPGLTFCEVELLEPGNERGMKYHMFYWDGARWTMLGPMWRAMR